MKIGIISDSHDNLINMQKCVHYLNNIGVDFVFHCGDIISPFTIKVMNELKCDYRAVFGNNDGEWLNLKEISKNRIFKPPYLFELDNKKFLLLHEGDIAMFIDNSIDFVFYGHTHVKYSFNKNGQLIVNPGTLAGYLADSATFAILDTNEFNVEFIDVDTI
ncbi:metallophosphoesterase [Deferribacter autotrophicus]|uniref:Phosphoesterase n=1 Tax=Deferribacter autotrophicus TaxID=500465 RepID=A0A5A8F143_9BACT|nr:metallophosphoesterase [Deferribacter autotrophicus]KAA0257379.1 metallophosphoesterase [Deferribacter autotrophicus]